MRDQDAKRARRHAATAGFTLLELMIVATILVIVASVGVPNYVSALRTARVGKCKHELVTISNQIDAFAAKHSGMLPLTLHQVGFGGKLDPWGVPYCYLNYMDGTGDGLEWAVAAGIVDPAAFGDGSGVSAPTTPEPEPEPTPTPPPTPPPTTPLGGLGGLLGRSVPLRPVRHPQGLLGRTTSLVGETVDYVAAKVRATGITTILDRDLSIIEVEALTSAIALNPDFAMFTGVNTEATRRRDRYMFPLNTDYDLFSLGPDGRTSVSLGENVGLDDVIRANNGGYFGQASNY